MVNMVFSVIGKDKFREGLQVYMKRHAYQVSGGLTTRLAEKSSTAGSSLRCLPPSEHRNCRFVASMDRGVGNRHCGADEGAVRALALASTLQLNVCGLTIVSRRGLSEWDTLTSRYFTSTFLC